MTAPTIWRMTCLAAKVLVAALIPQPTLAQLSTPKIKRHLREPPRKKRCYQKLPWLS